LGSIVLALSYGLRKKENKKENNRRSVNYAKGTLNKIGSKWLKKQKRRSKARESYLLNEKIEDDRSTRKMDRGQLNKRKNMSQSDLDHFVGKKERQVGEAQKMWVKEDLGF
jgi:hypothetical protein